LEGHRPADRRFGLGTRSARLAVLAAMVGLVAFGIPAAAATAQVFRPGLHLTALFPYGLVQAEPSIRVDSSGRMYVMAPGSTPIGCELWAVSPTLTSQTFLGAPDGGAGGGDCDLALSA